MNVCDCEIRRNGAGGDYELVWTASDGRTHAERSDDPADLVRRRRSLEEWLAVDGWVRIGRPTPPRPHRPSAEPQPLDEPALPAADEPAPGQRIIVRRGQGATFDLLARTFASDPAIEIIWDRRTGERRRAARPIDANRRRRERRRRPPDRWHRLNYLVLPLADSVTL